MSWQRTGRLLLLGLVAVLVAVVAFAAVFASGLVCVSVLEPLSAVVRVLLFVAARAEVFAVAASELAGAV